MSGNTTTVRKPHSGNLGYVSERKVQTGVGGYMVIYDRDKGFDKDGDYRWIVMHEPTGFNVCVSSLKRAREVMADAAIDPAFVLGIEDSDILSSPVYASQDGAE